MFDPKPAQDHPCIPSGMGPTGIGGLIRDARTNIYLRRSIEVILVTIVATDFL
jgi:hypothetical protein